MSDGVQCWEGDGEDMTPVPAELREKLMRFSDWFLHVTEFDTQAFSQMLAAMADMELVRELPSAPQIGAMRDTANTLSRFSRSLKRDQERFEEGMLALAAYQCLADVR